MILFWLMMGVLFCGTFNEIQKSKPLPPRYWATEIEHEVKHKADSALNNWAKWEIEKDSL